MLELRCPVASFENSFVIRSGLRNFLEIAEVLIDCVMADLMIEPVTIAQPLPARPIPWTDLAFSVVFASFVFTVLLVQSFLVSG